METDKPWGGNEAKFSQMRVDDINGQRTAFRKAVKGLTKLTMLDYIEYSTAHGTQRHITINSLRSALSAL